MASTHKRRSTTTYKSTTKKIPKTDVSSLTSSHSLSLSLSLSLSACLSLFLLHIQHRSDALPLSSLPSIGGSFASNSFKLSKHISINASVDQLPLTWFLPHCLSRLRNFSFLIKGNYFLTLPYCLRRRYIQVSTVGYKGRRPLKNILSPSKNHF